MFHASDVVQLQDGEVIQGIYRAHAATLAPRLLLAAVLILVPSFFLFALLQLGAFGVILVAVSVGYGLFLAAKSFIVWDSQVLLLTDRRAVHVDQSGVWRRSVSEVPLRLVQAVEQETTGPADAFLRTATLCIRASGSAPLVRFRGLSKASAVSRRITELRDSMSEHGFQTRLG